MKTVLQQLTESGHHIETHCKSGFCGMCRTRKSAQTGRVTLLDDALGWHDPDSEFLPCITVLNDGRIDVVLGNDEVVTIDALASDMRATRDEERLMYSFEYEPVEAAVREVAVDLGFEHGSSVEALEWVEAAERGLDLSDAARFERAAAAGFDVDTRWHPGRALFSGAEHEEAGFDFDLDSVPGYMWPADSESHEAGWGSTDGAMGRSSSDELDMSRNARLDRARMQGFDTTRTWFHGSVAAGAKQLGARNGIVLVDSPSQAWLDAGSYDTPQLHTGTDLLANPSLMDGLIVERAFTITDAQGTPVIADNFSDRDELLEHYVVNHGEQLAEVYFIQAPSGKVDYVTGRAQAIAVLDAIEHRAPGIYELYAKRPTADQVLTVDFKGASITQGLPESWILLDSESRLVATTQHKAEAEQMIAAGEAASYQSGPTTAQGFAGLARGLGLQGVELRNIEDEGPEGGHGRTCNARIVFDAAEVRSTGAAFDPDFSRSDYLMSSVALHDAATGDYFGTVNALGGYLSTTGFKSLVDQAMASGRIVLCDAESMPGRPTSQAVTDGTGRIYLNASRLSSTSVLPVLLHEAFHSGHLTLHTSPAWSRLMADLDELYSDYERNAKDALNPFFLKAQIRLQNAQQRYGQLSRHEAVMEFAAYSIEEHASAPSSIRMWVSRCVGTVQAWFAHRLNIQLGAVTPAQLRGMAALVLRDMATSPAPTQTPAPQRCPPMAYPKHSAGELGAVAEQQRAFDFDFSAPDSAVAAAEQGGVARGGVPLSVERPRVRIENVPVMMLDSATETAYTPRDVAHITAPFCKHAQETMLAVVVDSKDKVLSVVRHAKGAATACSVRVAEFVQAVTADERAEGVWFVHNHPSGGLEPSSSDHKITAQLREALAPLGVDYRGHVLLSPRNEYAWFYDEEETSAAEPIFEGDGARVHALPLTERLHTEWLPDVAATVVVDGPEAARAACRAASSGEAVVLLDNRHHVVGVVPFAAGQMGALRDGDRARQLVKALHETNAQACIIKSASQSDAENAARFLNGLDIRVLDWIHARTGVSDAETNGFVSSQRGHFYSDAFDFEALAVQVEAEGDAQHAVQIRPDVI